MKLAIAQHVQSFEALDRQLAYEAISDDPEDYQRCIARERTLELEACRKAGVPYFFILETQETRHIRMSGHGGQDPFKKHQLFDADRNPVESLTGYEVLLRTYVSHEQRPLEFIEHLGGRNVADWPSQLLTLEWYKHVRPEFLKRKLAWYRLDEVHGRDIGHLKDAAGRFFCKTSYKVQGYSGVTDDLVDFLGYQTEVMPANTEVIISEPLDLMTNDHGKLEYRCYVVRGRVSSISRYIDYATNYAIPPDIKTFVASFVAAHRHIMPECYVLDVAECWQRGPVVIELNGIVASGRYEKNYFTKLLSDLQIASNDSKDGSSDE